MTDRSEPCDAPIPLTPAIQRYAWGDAFALPRMLGLPVDGEPYAEAWYGAHPVAPALATVEGEPRPLDALVAERGATLLGPEVHGRFGGLPYLLKILTAARPLSIQVHPNRAQAEAGYAREQAAGVPKDAPNRCYRDRNHKPELLVALDRFDALCGFRPFDEIEAALASLPEIAALLPALQPDPDGLRQLLQAYFALLEEQLAPAWTAALERMAASSPKTSDGGAAHRETDPGAWALRAHRELTRPGAPPDRGLLFVFLLALVHLEPGEAMFLPAGVPHAYLSGSGIELMAESDNVLRAGLTSKHVDPEELLRVVRFDAGPPPRLEPVRAADRPEEIYPVPAVELDLLRWSLDADRAATGRAEGPQTLLALPERPGATVTVRTDGGEAQLGAGGACLLPDGARYRIEASGPATVLRVGAPPRQNAGSFRGGQPRRLAFGTSGLRGLVTDITDLEAYVNTRGFLDYLIAEGEAVPGARVALAGDLRPSTDGADKSILRAVTTAVTGAGLTPVHCGRLPTPALTYFALRRRWPSVMVTGSHIPFDRNGIKFNRPDGEVLKPEEAPILAAVERVRALEYGRAPRGSAFDDAGALRAGRAASVPEPTDEARRLYVRRYLDALPDGALAGVRVLLYEHSAVGREIVAEVLRGLGATVHPVGRSEQFVAIDTEAVDEARLAALRRLADEARGRVGPVDAIVSTDGDSDRPMLLGVTPDGAVRFIPGDVLGAVVADYLGADAVAVPVSANDAIDRHLGERGVRVERTRIGSPWVIAAMRAMQGERKVGWEANGGFLVGSAIELPDGGRLEPLPTRDAVLPIVAALHAARRRGLSLVELFAELPRRYGHSGLLDDVAPEAMRALVQSLGPGDRAVRTVRFAPAGVQWTSVDGSAAKADAPLQRRLEAVRERVLRHMGPERGFGELQELDLLDGVRMRFSNGDVAHVRPSGNAPQLRIYALADREERAQKIVSMAVAEPDGILRSLLKDGAEAGR